ncbi:hypothetical protein NUW54_g4121 [Trametes sanguinea]|uniref:Uncharacterized protein n=1 Tax=Trametes sanguinea TaxID=158606 RepID=A0ACC1Q0E3_9APHY|nr:hypothetical protein NUW54_g4121 [Trametes sanguinea]
MPPAARSRALPPPVLATTETTSRDVSATRMFRNASRRALGPPYTPTPPSYPLLVPCNAAAVRALPCCGRVFMYWYCTSMSHLLSLPSFLAFEPADAVHALRGSLCGRTSSCLVAALRTLLPRSTAARGAKEVDLLHISALSSRPRPPLAAPAVSYRPGDPRLGDELNSRILANLHFRFYLTSTSTSLPFDRLASALIRTSTNTNTICIWILSFALASSVSRIDDSAACSYHSRW